MKENDKNKVNKDKTGETGGKDLEMQLLEDQNSG